MRGAGFQPQGLGEPALVIQPAIRLGCECRHGPASKEAAIGPAPSRFIGHGLGAVLAELRVFSFAQGIRPGAAGAIKTVVLIDRSQGAQAPPRAGFAEHVRQHASDSGRAGRLGLRAGQLRLLGNLAHRWPGLVMHGSIIGIQAAGREAGPRHQYEYLHDDYLLSYCFNYFI